MHPATEELEMATAKELSDWLIRVEGKIDDFQKACNVCGQRIKGCEDSVSAAHHRIDDVRLTPGRSGPGSRAWASIIVTFITAVGSVFVAIFARHK
jgi:hypothetical protein